MPRVTLRWRILLGTLAASLAFCGPVRLEAQSAGRSAISGYDRSGANPAKSRSAAVAKHGMVATSQPLAVQAGLDVLRAGGNAADAAIAANAVMGLVEPMSCGIGGDLFVLYWDAKTQKLYGLNASGRSPFALNMEVFRQRQLAVIPSEGPLSWSIPGCVSGWEALHQRFGRAEWESLLAPAIAHAEDGFPVTEVISGYWTTGARALRRWPDSAKTFLIDGRAPREGEMFRNPNLAASYRAIAADGAKAYYQGPIAEKIVAFSEANGGFFSLRDFAEHTSDWVEPVSTNYRGHDVWQLPPNGQGLAVLQMLNVLEGYDLKSLGLGSPEYLHLLVEAKKLAFADRARYYADPDFAALPVPELISKEYAAKRRERINPNSAMFNVPAGDEILSHGDTIYLTVVDAERNCCSLIQSNFEGFGSKVVPSDVGFALQNRGALFALVDTHLNRLEPHKRPFHTIIPGMVTKDGRPFFSFGVMGGDMQPQGQVQVLVNMIDFGLDVQAAGDAARVRHDGSATPTGLPETPTGGTVIAESGISDATIKSLEAKGHLVRRGQDGGGYQGILIDWEKGTLIGGTEPRKDGMALGY
jgi:gamma-glutamyltranspeptidase/glutathione hydrolase